MRLRFSLFTKILLWFFLNIIVLGLALLLLFNLQFQRPLDAPLFGDYVNRVGAVARLITAEVREKSRAERDEILRRYAEAYLVDFLLYKNDGEKLAGQDFQLPAEVLQRITMPPLAPQHNEPGGAPPRPPPFPVSMMETSNPKRYWALVRMPVFESGKAEETRAMLVVSSDSRSGQGLFFDPVPWLTIIAAILLLSILLWLPFVRSLTQAIRQMTIATEQIAEEHFDVQLPEKRTDEIGRLGKAINHLAVRLSGFVHGQKRFLGDISHELNSPLARMQFALSILEDRVDPAQQSYVADVQEEVQLMSHLVGELLTYSRAGMKSVAVNLQPVSLHPLIQQIIARENTDGAEVSNEVPAALEVLANPELLDRALANVIRNAVRYAGAAGTIRVTASQQGDRVKLCIADQGNGVPEAALSKLFDPFYRLEADRARSTGGTGLGLAIVKTCVEACQGNVSARNIEPSGLEIGITLKAAI